MNTVNYVEIAAVALVIVIMFAAIYIDKLRKSLALKELRINTWIQDVHRAERRASKHLAENKRLANQVGRLEREIERRDRENVQDAFRELTEQLLHERERVILKERALAEQLSLNAELENHYQALLNQGISDHLFSGSDDGE